MDVEYEDKELVTFPFYHREYPDLHPVELPAKKFTDFGYPDIDIRVSPPPAWTLASELSEQKRIEFTSHAQSMLDHYNKIKDTNFEFVRLVRVQTYLGFGDNHYIQFEAKPSGAADHTLKTLEAAIYEQFYPTPEVALLNCTYLALSYHNCKGLHDQLDLFLVESLLFLDLLVTGVPFKTQNYGQMDIKEDRLAILLAKERTHPLTNIGCMKKGPMITDPKMKWYEKSGHLIGNEYFLHAYGPIYVLSAEVVASLATARNNSLRMFSNEDVTTGSWMLSMNVHHEDNWAICDPRCTPTSIAVWDIRKCSGLCNPTKRLKELHKIGICSRSPTLPPDVDDR